MSKKEVKSTEDYQLDYMGLIPGRCCVHSEGSKTGPNCARRQTGGTLIHEDPPTPVKSPIVILIILGHCAAPAKVVSYYNKSRIGVHLFTLAYIT